MTKTTLVPPDWPEVELSHWCNLSPGSLVTGLLCCVFVCSRINLLESELLVLDSWQVKREYTRKYVTCAWHGSYMCMHGVALHMHGMAVTCALHGVAVTCAWHGSLEINQSCSHG